MEVTPLVPLVLRGRSREWVLNCRRELVENLDHYPASACENRKKAVKSAQSGSSSAVECFLAKEEVAGSNPVFRSRKSSSCGGVAKRLRQGSAKPPCGGSNPPAAFSNYRSPGRGGGMVDAADLKSASCKGVWVRVPPSAVDRHRRNSENKTSKTPFQ
jgi:hypothetical protein